MTDGLAWAADTGLEISIRALVAACAPRDDDETFATTHLVENAPWDAVHAHPDPPQVRSSELPSAGRPPILPKGQDHAAKCHELRRAHMP